MYYSYLCNQLCTEVLAIISIHNYVHNELEGLQIEDNYRQIVWLKLLAFEYVSTMLPNQPDQPASPLTRPFEPGGEPDPPLFVILRDSTQFWTLEVGFNPIQPFSTRNRK